MEDLKEPEIVVATSKLDMSNQISESIGQLIESSKDDDDDEGDNNNEEDDDDVIHNNQTNSTSSNQHANERLHTESPNQLFLQSKSCESDLKTSVGHDRDENHITSDTSVVGTTTEGVENQVQSTHRRTESNSSQVNEMHLWAE